MKGPTFSWLYHHLYHHYHPYHHQDHHPNHHHHHHVFISIITFTIVIRSSLSPLPAAAAVMLARDPYYSVHSKAPLRPSRENYLVLFLSFHSNQMKHTTISSSSGITSTTTIIILITSIITNTITIIISLSSPAP